MTQKLRYCLSILLVAALLAADPAFAATRKRSTRRAKTTQTTKKKSKKGKRTSTATRSTVAKTVAPVNDDADDEEEVDDSADLRDGAVNIPEGTDDIDIPIPAFIHRKQNVIDLNGADWSRLRTAFGNSGKRTVSIVHIGDSHVQADINTGIMRSLLQYDYGNAGRGLISPLKLSNTNQPFDYVFQSSGKWTANKLMSPKWQQTVGFTGASIKPSAQSSEITVGTCGNDDYNPFSSLTLFHKGKLTVTGVTGQDGQPLEFRAIPSKDYTQILLHSQEHSVTVHFNTAGDLTLFGASLSGDRPGVFYHAIGNNGAAYDTYNRIGNVGAGIAPLKPDLVIISLGTNEAFGRANTAAFRQAIDRLVGNIRAANPNAAILLTTPMECQRSVVTTSKVKVRSKARGSRRAKTRTVNRTQRSYAVNTNIAPLRNAIVQYGKEHGIAVYDWYDVAGGQGAAATWIANGLYAGDRVHHTRKGYNLEGRLLYDALSAAIEK